MRRGRRLPLEVLAPYLLEIDAADPRVTIAPLQRVTRTINDRVSWPQVFANANPVEVEVGFGKGLFLLNSGQAKPQTNFFGIEIERKYALFTATRLATRGLRNVKVASCDARWFLEALVAPTSVAAVHVYFPDPWWKKRHRKRRLFTDSFALECARILTQEGVLHLVSDVKEYFEESKLMLANIKDLAALPVPQVRDPEHEMDFLTNFERKYRREGRPIYRGAWRKLN